MLSAIVFGLRMSLGVGAMSTVIALSLGMSIGVLAAYFGGKVDAAIMRVVDLQLSFPSILVALILLAVLGKGVDKVIIALIIVQWAYYARTVRGTALVERRKGYIERSEEHTSELQSLMRISYAVFCLKKKIKRKKQ